VSGASAGEPDQLGWRSRLRAAAGALRGPLSEGEDRDPAADSIDRAIETLAAASIEEVQRRGYHFQRRDYYSALNDLVFLRENWDLWHDRPLPAGIEWDLDAQLGEVRRIAPYLAEMADIPRAANDDAPTYHWENDFWRGADAMVHYGLLRDVKPRRVVEIGAGWSSLLMADALERNHAEGAARADVDQIEPYPRTTLLSALPEHWSLHETILQRADLRLFDALGAGDVCFYDGSHVARAGSDVVWFFFEVLPRLRPGVLVHIHDVLWPADYPDEWIFERGQTWNEQYVLQAFLMYNELFEPIICNSMLFQRKRKALEELFAVTPETQHSGVSVWLRRL
jgi:hypothetical protein